MGSRLAERSRADDTGLAPKESVIETLCEVGGEFALDAALPERCLAAVCITGPLVERQYARKTRQVPETPNHRLRQVVVDLALRGRNHITRSLRERGKSSCSQRMNSVLPLSWA
jgi:hypothetical protein